ncbi:MAG: methyl-accepting chemotaxis protein [Christensenellaceae bacterium]|jgi:methyl-accepting chemotaxis protein
MKNMKIKNKLVLGFSIMIVFCVAISLTSIFSLISLADETQLLSDRASNAVISARLEENTQEQRASYRGASLYRVLNDTERFQRDTNALIELDDEFVSGLDVLQAGLVDPQAIEIGNGIDAVYVSYQQARDNLLAILNDGESTEEAILEGLSGMTEPATAVIDSVAALTNRLDELTNEQAADALATETRSMTIIIIVMAVAVATSGILGVYLARIISAPLTMMMGFLKQVGDTGNLNFTDDEWRRTREQIVYKDETSESLSAFVDMLEQMIYYGETLERIAQRDLTVAVKTKGSSDTMGSAITEMVDNLNQMMTEIRNSANEVASGAAHVAQGAQELASGSTEQAASVQQISASISETLRQSEENTKEAGAALGDVMQAGEYMNQSMESMSRLTKAMEDINASSSDISKVIKAIEDIAFQTNILALNAAVEAARAGEAGKGFAVVADEVRNLAQKSAEAAKETSALIENSIEKAAEGNSITAETGESLGKVAEIAGKNAESMQKISQLSEAQTAAITEINSGVQQISTVVQSNSATSEQSAAASEEMSSQAQVMNGIVSRFKIREDGRRQVEADYSSDMDFMSDAGGVDGIADDSDKY